MASAAARWPPPVSENKNRMWGLSLPGGFIFTSGDDRFQPVPQFAAGEQNPAVAAKAFQPDVRPEANDAPVIAAAGMRFTHPQDILQAQLWQHAADYTTHVIILFIRFGTGDAPLCSVSTHRRSSAALSR